MSYNKTLSRKEMDIKLNAVDYKIWGIMQDRVYARMITSRANVLRLANDATVSESIFVK